MFAKLTGLFSSRMLIGIAGTVMVASWLTIGVLTNRLGAARQQRSDAKSELTVCQSSNATRDQAIADCQTSSEQQQALSQQLQDSLDRLRADRSLLQRQLDSQRRQNQAQLTEAITNDQCKAWADQLVCADVAERLRESNTNRQN